MCGTDMCQNELWLRQLKSFVSSFEPNGCNHEEFPGVKVSFQALDSKIKENDEEDKKLHNKNENLKSEIQQSDNVKKRGRRKKERMRYCMKVRKNHIFLLLLRNFKVEK